MLPKSQSLAGTLIDYQGIYFSKKNEEMKTCLHQLVYHGHGCAAGTV